VNAALGFLAAICQRPHYKASFEAVLEGICQGVIIKNLMLRQEDIEIYKEDPFEFLKRDIEGRDFCCLMI
jgi:exportin-2 (importin alpha re-exporter)